MGTSLLMGGVAFALAVLLGKPVIALLKRFKIGKQIRIDGPQSHMVKAGTPTMGGIVFVLTTSILIAAMYLYSRIGARVVQDFGGVVLVGRSLAIPMLVMISFALFGAIDDYMGVRGVRRGEGMRGRTKAMIQLGIAVIAALVMNIGFGINRLGVPGLAQPIGLGILWIPIAVFIIHATANAVNMTDGLDGLAALISLVCYAAYGVVAFLQGQVFLTMLCMVMVGALLGFLWFNVHPAQFFMGGIGSESLGATLGVIALMTGQWLLLPVIAIVPVAEALSVIIQVSYFKRTKKKYGEGKRFFKMSPLHNHFVLLGWSESQIVQRFWLIGIIAGMVGVGLALFGNAPAVDAATGMLK
ncbi:MAG: phospho-N-acetylmuramoyl-pentapeptide-transferase [Anaerolineae bacterium]|nr:phospho-N-acetylmuramoyl-pentapeptide-transferase [Anaerolineae bacterium]